LQLEINRIEKELARRSATYRDLTSLLSTRWENIPQNLAPNESAVELTRFPYYQFERKTDTAFYAALMLNARDSLRPKFILLGDARVIEDTSLVRQFYRSLEKRSKKASTIGKIITSLLWTPLGDQLANISSLIISPDGIYHQLSFAALPDEKGTLLLERFAFQYVTSTRQLLSSDGESNKKNLALFASPDYSASLAEHILQPATMTELLRPLPETLVEADVISKEFSSHDWTITKHVKQGATEAELRRLRAPGILHIATHARFEAPSSKPSLSDRSGSVLFPLTSSVLYLAGANTGSRDPANDGIVSALEVSDLALQGTNLVTISACESGRGVIQPGEGVFGLSRSLMIAGARNVLLSLWQVPDRETRELMSNFYKHYLDGETMANALRSAQLVQRETVRNRYKEDIPLYWAAFVLISN
jgi:CHAT domain-containing protein